MSKRDVSIKCVYASPEKMLKKDIVDKTEEIYPFIHASDGLSEENMMEEVYAGPDFDLEPIENEEESPMACVYVAPQKKKNKLFSEIFKRKK